MIVTFDTNAYRDLVKDVPISEIKSMMDAMMLLESQKNITAMIGSVASMEMLSHLVDSRFSKAYRACIRACVATYHHCGNAQQYRMLPSVETQVAHSFFQIDDQKAIENQKTLSNLLFQIWQEPGRKTINDKSLYPSFKSVKDKVVNSERVLIEEILGYSKLIDPNYKEWNLLVGNKSMRTKYLNFIKSPRFEEETAKAVIEAVRLHLNEQGANITLSDTQMNSMASALSKAFPVALELRRFFFSQLIQPNFNLTERSRANFMWDEQILYYVGQTVQGEDILLVTTDKKMLKAAKDLGYTNSVKSLNEYLHFIGFDPEPYRVQPCWVVRYYWKVKGKVFKVFKRFKR